LNQTIKESGIIAIVDDDAPLREALSSVLNAAGFSTQVFATAEDFLSTAPRQNITCLVLDIRLPGMNGIELQRALNTEGSNIPIVFITAHGDATVKDLVMGSGAAAFLSKPVRSGALLKEIQSALKA
jgi:FixJ family two-component response regulator